VAVNLARSRLRRVGAEVRAYARLAGRGSGDVSERDPVAVELEGFWAAVRQLPARQAQAVALYYLEDLSAGSDFGPRHVDGHAPIGPAAREHQDGEPGFA